MPPKPKFTREEIVAAALELVSAKGMEALTSRDLGAQLGSSARPIFTVFRNMEEVQQAVQQAAMERFNAFAQKAMQYTPAFKQFGMQMLLFAQEEPKLFQLLFMSENEQAKSFRDVLAALSQVSLFSPWYSYRLFQRHTGLTVTEYVRRLRLSRSAMRLKHERCRVTDVAYEMGFGSVDGYQRAEQ